MAIHETVSEMNAAAAEFLAGWLTETGVRNVMPAAGNTPLELYRLIADKKLNLRHLTIFTLDEYGGVPDDEPRNCTNLLRRSVAEPWGIPANQFFGIHSEIDKALESVLQHEARIESAGGIDLIVLGLGQNGHLGFNEPGSPEDSTARLVDLEPVSVEANREWFQGRYAPDKGATIGLKTILHARRVLVMAAGVHKTAAVRAMVRGPRDSSCPASFLQNHPNAHLFIDRAAAGRLKGA